jgi:hypothetical protein
MTKLRVRNLCVLALALICLACEDGSNANREPEIVLFEFSMLGDAEGIQDFVAQTNDPDVIVIGRAQLALPLDQRQLFINGPIARGNADVNRQWSWHFVPNEWSFAEAAIEVCDGNAVLVEQAVDYWVDTVGHFCPWGASVVGQGNMVP